MRSYTPSTLQIRKFAEGDRICCGRCGFALTNLGSSWKHAAIVREISTDEPTGEFVTGDPAETVVRQFVCRGCGLLLDTETALPGEPFLEDTMIV